MGLGEQVSVANQLHYEAAGGICETMNSTTEITPVDTAVEHARLTELLLQLDGCEDLSPE